MMRSCLAISIVIVVGLASAMSPQAAAKVKVWQHVRAADYNAAKFKNVVVDSSGVLRLARKLKRYSILKTDHIWDLAEDKNGNLYVATGNEGKLYKVTPDGKSTVVWTSTDSQVLCLRAAQDGSIYAGTGPTGILMRIDPKGNRRIIADRLDRYIWSLVLDEQTGTIYAGTGPKGRIWEIPKGGKAAVFYDTIQDHILCLARCAKGMVYAGTDKGGVVYRINPRGRGFVVYTAPQSEVRSLLVSSHGIYAGTSSPSSKSGGGGRSASSESLSSLSASAIRRLSTTGKKRNVVRAVKMSAGKALSNDESDAPQGSKPAPSLPAPQTGENSLYRIAADGTVKELFREQAMILTMLRRRGRLLAGTGMKGQLFEIDEKSKTRTELARLDHGQIHCMLQRRDGSIVLGTGDPGRLYTLQDGYAKTGMVVSEVLDAKILSQWGTAVWRADIPAGATLSVAFRSGNTTRPDQTWSDWTAEQTKPESTRVTCPTARFLQYRITMGTSNPRKSPGLRAITLRYATTNQAPEITRIDVPDLEIKTLKKPGKLLIKWRATDPNEDALSYDLWVRKKGWNKWICLKEGLDEQEYKWDAATMPSGRYRIKVVANDRSDNPQVSALTGERISTSFPVSHQAPKVSMRIVNIGTQAVIEAKAADPMIRLTGADYSINGKRWQKTFPRDGMFDSKTETFRFRIDGLRRSANYVIVLRVRNAAGNSGTADAVFTVPKQSR